MKTLLLINSRMKRFRTITFFAFIFFIQNAKGQIFPSADIQKPEPELGYSLDFTKFEISSLAGCPGPGNYGTIKVTPSKSVYCLNDNIQFVFNKTNPNPYAGSLNWTFTGSANNTAMSGANNVQYNITGLLSGGDVIVNGALTISGVTCTFSVKQKIIMSDLVADAGPDVLYIPCAGAVNVGTTPCALNGTPPYNPPASWSPAAGIVGPSTGCQIQVDNLVSDQTYMITVNDQFCTATSQMNVLVTCPSPGSIASIITTPNQTQYCLGGNITGNLSINNGCFSLTGPVSWNFTGAPALVASGTNDVNYSITGLNSSGVITASGSMLLNGGSLICPYSLQTNITLSNLTANAGSNKVFVPGGGAITIGTALCATNGVPPYIPVPSWSPLTGIVGASTGCQIQVNNLTSNTTYILTVSDQYCIATSQMTVMVSTMYFELKRELDGSYFTAKNGNLFFTIDGEYNSTALDYKVYNYKRTVMPGLSVTPSNLDHGDNRFFINVSSLATGYYVLEVLNQKKEKRVLRFYKS